MWVIYPNLSWVFYRPCGNHKIKYYECICAGEVTVKDLLYTGNIDRYHQTQQGTNRVVHRVWCRYKSVTFLDM